MKNYLCILIKGKYSKRSRERGRITCVPCRENAKFKKIKKSWLKDITFYIIIDVKIIV